MRAPWRCRWFGHDMRSAITGGRVDVFVLSAEAGGWVPVRCRRCRAWWDEAREEGQT